MKAKDTGQETRICKSREVGENADGPKSKYSLYFISGNHSTGIIHASKFLESVLDSAKLYEYYQKYPLCIIKGHTSIVLDLNLVLLHRCGVYGVLVLSMK
jgi:hypothetical protein